MHLQGWHPTARFRTGMCHGSCNLQDLLELGFWQALLRQTDRHARSFWEDPGRLPWADRMFPHWRRSLWRPLQAPLCDFPQPLPSDEID